MLNKLVPYKIFMCWYQNYRVYTDRLPCFLGFPQVAWCGPQAQCRGQMGVVRDTGSVARALGVLHLIPPQGAPSFWVLKGSFGLHGREVSGWNSKELLLLESIMTACAEDSQDTRGQNHQRFWKCNIWLSRCRRDFKNCCDGGDGNSLAGDVGEFLLC